MPKKITKLSKFFLRNLTFTENVLNWGRLNGRKKLPWNPVQNNQYDPYKVWVSEIMLQQTQLKTGIKFFERFLVTFPKIEDLAKSKLETVLSAWSGLGYYSRAKNLHNAALKIYSKGKVTFPKNAKEWEELPGIGFSTAASISSFVNQERVPVMDVNVLRIFARQFTLEECIGSNGLKKKVLPIAEKLLPSNCNDMPMYTQSIMDLGSIICRPRDPKCDECPVSNSCYAYEKSEVINYPVKKQNVSRERKKVNWLIPYTNDSVGLVFLKNSKLWQGLWTPIQISSEPEIPNGASFVKKFKIPISNFILEVVIWGIFCNDKRFYKSVRWFNREDLLNGAVPTTVKKALTSTWFCS